MSSLRPDWHELSLVHANERILRWVRPEHLEINAEGGFRIKPAALSIHECNSTDLSYGASVFVASAIGSSLNLLRQAYPKWERWHISLFHVRDLLALGVEVRWSPYDCALESVRHAHASLRGVTRVNRQEILFLLEQGLRNSAAMELSQEAQRLGLGYEP